MIYTSRFQNPELNSGEYTVLGIVRGLPRFKLGYERVGNLIALAPTKELFSINDLETFAPRYKKHLDTIGVESIAKLLKEYKDLGKDVVLCCYEDVRVEGEWCHRIVFAEWWKERTGEIIPELKNESPITVKRAIKPPMEKTLIRVAYSVWSNPIKEDMRYDGGDIYYIVDRITGKSVKRLADSTAREMITSGVAEVVLDYGTIPRIEFIIAENSSVSTRVINKDNLLLSMHDALKLIKDGKAFIHAIKKQ